MIQRKQRDKEKKAFFGCKFQRPGLPKGQVPVHGIEIWEMRKGKDSRLRKDSELEGEEAGLLIVGRSVGPE